MASLKDNTFSKYGFYEGGLIKGPLTVKRWEPLAYIISKMKMQDWS